MGSIDLGGSVSLPQLQQQCCGGRYRVGAQPRPELRCMRYGQRTAAVMTAEIKSSEFGFRGRVRVHLPHTAGVRRRGGDRQGYRGEGAHQQQNQQKSGGQAMHKWLCGRSPASTQETGG